MIFIEKIKLKKYRKYILKMMADNLVKKTLSGVEVHAQSQFLALDDVYLTLGKKLNSINNRG